MADAAEIQAKTRKPDFRGTMEWLRGRKLCECLLAVAVFSLISVLYHRYGIAPEDSTTGRSVFRWMQVQWNHESFRNNWVMLLVAAYAVYYDRDRIIGARLKVEPLGVVIVFLSFVLHFLCFKAQQPRISLFAMVVSYWGAALALWGWDVAKALLFPAGYAIVCFLSSALGSITMPLRLMSTSFAEFLLKGANIIVTRTGTVITAVNGKFQFEVADGCSGLRSLTVMVALAAPYAYFTMRGTWRKWALFALAVPLAMLANTLRIFTLGVVAEGIGESLAMSLYHDFSGYMVFIIAIGLLVASGNLLDKDWRSKWSALKRSVSRQAR